MSGALRAALAEIGVTDIPWDRTPLPHQAEPPAPGITVVIRSRKTVRDLIAEMPPEYQATKFEECRVYGTPLDEPYTGTASIARPAARSTYFAGWSFDKWLDYEEAKLPAGYVVAGPTVETVRAWMLHSSGGRDDAIRTALTEGVSVADLVRETGLSRARIYQIRDGRR